MKARLANLFWKVVLLLVVIGVIYAALPSHSDTAARKAMEETRLTLHQQGFKTDLADFDLSTTPELRARQAILTNTVHYRFAGPGPEHPNLMQPIGDNSAMVVWKLDSLKRENRSSFDDSEQLAWQEFRDAINQNQSLYDPACLAILSGPIRFNLNASRGSAMLLPHLAVMKNLAQTLGDRTMLALHDGDKDAAWTNLMAATRLVTAWEPEPVEISHLVRFANLSLVFNATWQALQTNGWQDDRLTRLQTEWESFDLFTNLPATAAFKRASDVAVSQRGGQEHLEPNPPLTDFFKESLRSPFSILDNLNYRWNRAIYLRRGSYVDQKDMLLFYRDRELELRNAIQSPTWVLMRQLPGVTNEISFQSKYSSRVQMMMNLRRINMRIQRQGSSLLVRAAAAEAQRRILITAIALERYHGKHGSYPATLAALTPEFLKTPLPDFMDGQALRYRPADDGHFLLYSVGQDCVDNGGKSQRSWRDIGFDRPPPRGAPGAEFDLVWPLPVSDAAIQEEQQIQTEAEKTKAEVQELRHKEYLKEISDREWEQSLSRQSRVAQILATNWSDPSEGPTFKGQSVQSLIGNVSVSGTNKLSLCALLTPKQIITGNEPEDITLEFPISYDVITNGNILFVNVDGDPKEQWKLDSGGKVYDRERATNGDYLLVWHAIYDPPGPHAVQAYLVLEDDREGRMYMNGPPVAVTTTNLCQFSLDCVNYDVDLGARFHARLPEKNGNFSIECLTTNGEHLKTLTGSTTNGEFITIWNLVDDRGNRLHGETFNSIVHITLPDSGRTQTLRGP
jgi:hypothetical protein